jgi:hypothetical protein
MTSSRRRLGVLLAGAAIAAAATLTVSAGAQPATDTPAPPLPVFTPTPTAWAPNVAFPHNRHQNRVTEADITAEREMCEWFTAQFDVLMGQIIDFNNRLAAQRDDYAAPGMQQHADAVTANIDQSEEFLAPRARGLTLVQDCTGSIDESCTTDYAIFEGKDFHRLWQQQSNISTSIKNRNASWVTNISIGLTNLYANGIRGSRVCG